MTSVTCVTSRYLPNLRHLARLHEADVAVLLDLALLPDRNAKSFVNRNRVLNTYSGKTAWLTVPIARGRGQIMRDVRIAPLEREWPETHMDRITAFFPDHAKVAPRFISTLSELVVSHPPELLALNSTLNAFLLSTLNQPLSLTLESEVVQRHSPIHRLDVSIALGANQYVAGEVEWKTMQSSGELQRFEAAGIEVVRSPNRSETRFDERTVRDLSCIDAICRHGIAATSEILARMIESGREQEPLHSASD